MRFLVVYQDFIKPCKELLDRLSVEDVEIICVQAGDRSLREEALDHLVRNPSAPIAICQVHRKIKQAIPRTNSIEYETKQFRNNDQQLKAWLEKSSVNPDCSAMNDAVRPSQAFQSAIQKTLHLYLADGALDRADEIAQHRWSFVERSVNLLVRLANGENLGSPRDWKSRYNVPFAVNGRVVYKTSVSYGGTTRNLCTEWHLKEGDNTSVESAARIYFNQDRVGGDGILRVYVFYVGPHPQDGCYVATFR